MSDITDQWRARLQATDPGDPVRVVLPSGLPVRVRRLSLFDLFTMGTVPDALSPLVLEWFDAPKRAAERGGDTNAEIIESINRNLADYYRVRNFVWHACVVEPKFWQTPDEALSDPSLLPYSKVSDTDRQYLMDYCQGVGGDAGESVATFLDRYSGRLTEPGRGQDSDVGAVEGRDDLRPGPGADAGHPAGDGPVAVVPSPARGAYLG